MLTSALEQYREQQRISAHAQREARRRAGRGPRAIAAVIATYQLEAAANALNHAPATLSEQGIEAPTVATVSATSVLTGASVLPALNKLANAQALDRIVKTLVVDAGRTATTIDMARRPKVTAYVRSLNLPSCSRCAILAGRVYYRSTGFQRHPRCDCLMTLSSRETGPELVIDPDKAVRDGHVRGLSKADMAVLEEGGNLNRIVNVRSKKAGLSVGSSVTQRGDKLTPAGIMHRAGEDRNLALRLMHTNGYIYRPQLFG